MLILLFGEPPETYAALADGLRAAGHIVRLLPADNSYSPDEKDRADALIAPAFLEPAAIQRVLNGDDARPAIALLDQDTLSTWDPSGPWTDFAVAPYRPAELAARLALHTARNKAEDTEIIRSGALTIDVGNYSVHVHGERIELTYKEYELLKFLVSHPGRVFTRESLLEQVWGYDYWGGSRTIDVHIRRIRSKLPANTASMIETVHQVGYRYAASRG